MKKINARMASKKQASNISTTAVISICYVRVDRQIRNTELKRIKLFNNPYFSLFIYFYCT